jgi:DNA-binding protein HU-beta
MCDHRAPRNVGFGSFKRTETGARTGRNPATGQPLDIKASARPAFTSGKGFKDMVKETYGKEG